MSKKVKIFPISEKMGETPFEVEEAVNELLKKHPLAEVKAGGNFVVVIYDEIEQETLKISCKKEAVPF
jgi:hypothetical protein